MEGDRDVTAATWTAWRRAHGGIDLRERLRHRSAIEWTAALVLRSVLVRLVVFLRWRRGSGRRGARDRHGLRRGSLHASIWWGRDRDGDDGLGDGRGPLSSARSEEDERETKGEAALHPFSVATASAGD